MNEQAAADWRDACDNLQRKAAAIGERRERSGGTGSGRLNRATFILIREGAATGDRHRALFAAAANLAEFGCPPLLAHELLTEAGLDCGLPPSEVCRQIDKGLAHGSRSGAGDVPTTDSPNALAELQDAPEEATSTTTSSDLQAALLALWNDSRKAVTQ